VGFKHQCESLLDTVALWWRRNIVELTGSSAPLPYETLTPTFDGQQVAAGANVYQIFNLAGYRYFGFDCSITGTSPRYTIAVSNMGKGSQLIQGGYYATAQTGAEPGSTLVQIIGSQQRTYIANTGTNALTISNSEVLVQ